jgi:hypothetical protein
MYLTIYVTKTTMISRPKGKGERENTKPGKKLV